MEFILGFLVGSWWWALPIVYMVGAVFDSNDWKFASFVCLATLAAAVYALQLVPVTYMWYAAAAYIPIGITWSIWRWRQYVQYKVANELETATAGNTYPYRDLPSLKDRIDLAKTRCRDRLSLADNAGRVTGWALLWPMSIVSNIVGDLYDVLKEFILTKLNRIYAAIVESALK